MWYNNENQGHDLSKFQATSYLWVGERGRVHLEVDNFTITGNFYFHKLGGDDKGSFHLTLFSLFKIHI